MHKILIVDDEYWVGRWLRDLLEKSSFEVEIVEVCQDAEEALRVLKNKHIDILITDINMPVLTGLELIRQAKELGQKVPKTIVISGYDEFEYARQAIELEVMAYLIKPLEREAVFEALKKAIDSLKREYRQNENAYMGYHAEVENILVGLFCHPQDRLKKRLEDIFSEKGLKEQYYMVGIIQNASLEVAVIAKEKLQEKLEKACRSRHVFLFQRDIHTWGFLVAGIKKSAGYYIESNVLLSILNGYSWGTSKLHQDFQDMEEAVGEAKRDIMQQLKGEQIPVVPLKLEMEIKTEFLVAIEARDKEKIKQCAYVLEKTFLKAPDDMTSCLNFYFILTGEVLELLAASYQKSKESVLLELIDEGYEFCVQIREFYSAGPICRKFLEYSLRVAECLGETEPMTVSAIVQKVQRIIREQYASNLSLGTIADEFDINPSYFSKKFKDETGVNFVEYVSGVRIEQAKALLKNTELSVSKVSKRVGFHDSKYFSKVFVSIVGEKPSEYRIRYGEEEADD